MTAIDRTLYAMFACAAPLLIGAAAITNASGFDDTVFRRWVEMRVEGIDTARLDRSRSTPQIAHQLSRKTFV